MPLTKALLTLSIACLTAPSMAQDTVQSKQYSPKNTVFLELGGIGLTYSLNYQRNFTISKHFDIVAGIAVNPLLLRHDDNRNQNTPIAELTLQGLYKFGRNEIGLGGAYGCYTYYSYYYRNGEATSKLKPASVAFTSLGYGRTWGKHIYTGAYFWLLIADNGYTEPTAWGGVRIGYRFGK